MRAELPLKGYAALRCQYCGGSGAYINEDGESVCIMCAHRIGEVGAYPPRQTPVQRELEGFHGRPRLWLR